MIEKKLEKSDMTWDEKWELSDFWGYCDSVKKEMFSKIEKHKLDALPIPNQMICIAFAAMTWHDHVKAIEANNRKFEIGKTFEKEHGKDFIFLNWFTATTKPSEMTWGAQETILKSSELDEQEKFLAATESDFRKLPGVGKARLKTMLWLQKEILAHREFYAKHPSYVEGGAE